MQWENLCGEDLRGMLIQLLTVIRGNSFNLDFGTSILRIAPWLPRSGETLSGVYSVRLINPSIEYTYNSGNLWNISIEVMKWQG